MLGMRLLRKTRWNILITQLLSQFAESFRIYEICRCGYLKFLEEILVTFYTSFHKILAGKPISLYKIYPNSDRISNNSIFLRNSGNDLFWPLNSTRVFILSLGPGTESHPRDSHLWQKGCSDDFLRKVGKVIGPSLGLEISLRIKKTCIKIEIKSLKRDPLPTMLMEFLKKKLWRNFWRNPCSKEISGKKIWTVFDVQI